MRQTDPAAQRALDQLVAAHQALFTFSCRLKVEAIGEKRRESSTTTLAYQKPNKIRLEVAREKAPRFLCVSDGTTRRVGSLKRKAEAGERALVDAIGEAQVLIAPLFLFLVSRSAPTRTLLPGTVKTLGFGNPLVLDGVPTEVVLADVATNSGTARLTLAMGKDDHLLRKLSIDASYKQETLSLVEVYTEVKANPSLNASLFVLPK